MNDRPYLPQPNSASDRSVTLREGLERYYQSNPTFVRNQDLQVGFVRIPWCDLQRHDLMHVVTGYSTALDHELRLIGFLLTALTWKRPWYYYVQSLGVFLELLARSLRGKTWGSVYYSPLAVCRLYGLGMQQGRSVQPKIDAYIDPETVMDQPIEALRSHYGIRNAGAWDLNIDRSGEQMGGGHDRGEFSILSERDEPHSLRTPGP